MEREVWLRQFTQEPPELSEGDRASWLAQLKDVSLASDAFFPFRDSLDVAARYGVSWVAQPGGSVADEEVTAAAGEYGMAMVHGVPRLFHH